MSDEVKADAEHEESPRGDMRAKYQQCVRMAQTCARLLSSYDLPAMLDAIDRAHSLGSILDPTLYRDKQDAEILRAARALWEIGKKLSPDGASRTVLEMVMCSAFVKRLNIPPYPEVQLGKDLGRANFDIGVAVGELVELKKTLGG